MSENYIPLYRKYRPQKLEEVVGQEHIKTALTNAINLSKISHAYLFTGPRGTGKTSTARILAKSLNCKNGPTVSPCGECVSCQNIINSVPIDVIEIDAASNRKVEDAHNILEKVQYVPVNGQYKIYIIDEVHMLTDQAFNALLKTLEEPPENVIFILATTESHKVLDTIKSRCQRFDFKRITTNDIQKHLRYISDKEKIKISDEALFSIAKNSSGGMRDSIALLDQVSILGVSKEVTEEDINRLLGRLSFDTLNKIAEDIIDSNAVSVINLVEEVYNSGNEPIQILTNLMYYFKNLLITKSCDEEFAIDLTNLNDVQIKALKEQQEKLETHQIVFLIEKIANYIQEIKKTTNQQMWLEVAFIDLANLTINTKLSELQSRLTILEQGGLQVNSQPPKISKPVVTVKSTDSVLVPEKKLQQENKETQESKQELNEDFTPMPKSKHIDKSTDINFLWQQLLSNINSTATQAMLKLANPVKITSEEVIITFKQEIFVKRIDEVKKGSIINAADILFNQKNTKVTIRTPLPSDVEIQNITQVQIEPISQKTARTLVEPNTVPTEEEIEAVNETSKQIDSIPNEVIVKETSGPKSDQSEMIKQLFDGKYIN